MSTLIRMFLSLLAVSLISTSPIMTDLLGSRDLTLESAQNSQPLRRICRRTLHGNISLLVPAARPRRFRLGGKGHESNNVQSQ